jgi:hypothetical protein
MRCATPAGKRMSKPVMPWRQERDELGTAPWNRVLSTHRGELLLEHHDERLTDHGRDLAIAVNSGAQKTQGNYCTICCTIPRQGRLARGIINDFFDVT